MHAVEKLPTVFLKHLFLKCHSFIDSMNTFLKNGTEDSTQSFCIELHHQAHLLHFYSQTGSCSVTKLAWLGTNLLPFHVGLPDYWDYRLVQL